MARVINKKISERFLTFDLEAELPIANRLRRILLGEIPVRNADKVQIYQNLSHFPDEILVERIGKLPIIDQDYEGLYSLDVIAEEEPVMITSDDFTPEGKIKSHLQFINLDLDQEVELTFTTSIQIIKKIP